MTDDLPEPMDLPDPSIVSGGASWIDWIPIVLFVVFATVMLVWASLGA